jgi:hypothetical protein
MCRLVVPVPVGHLSATVMVNENSLTPLVNAYLVCAPEVELAGAEFVSLIVLLTILPSAAV